MSIKKIVSLITLFLSIQAILFAQDILVSRVAFTKPGTMMRIPSSSIYKTPYIFRAGFASELYSFTDSIMAARGVFFETDVTPTMKFGFSSIQGPESGSSPVQFGFNLQKRLMIYGDISFAAGVFDLVLSKDQGQLSLNSNSFSIFGMLSSEKKFANYELSTYLGFGTGGLAQGFGEADTTSSAGVFAGFRMRTDFLAEKGGTDIIGEFDGGGLNVGVRFPITEDYHINVGITHVENLPAFGDEYSSNSPGICLGLDLAIPRIKPETAKAKLLEGMVDEESRMVMDLEEQFSAKLDSTLKAADFVIQQLRDSLRISRAEIQHLNTQVAMLQQKVSILEDSVRSVKLAKHVMEQNINLALKHLSRSLRYVYAGDYTEALQEVNMAIDLNPNLALAYARRGSIYYKLGDVERATINWNLALRIDPEYDDVRNILKAIHENRLRTASFVK